MYKLSSSIASVRHIRYPLVKQFAGVKTSLIGQQEKRLERFWHKAQASGRGREKHTASLEMIASSPGLTPCLANSRAAYPCKIYSEAEKNEFAFEI
jgi:hypothetical protein